MSENTTTRRRVLLGSGTLVAGTVTSIVAFSDNTTATVDGEFTIPNGDVVLTDTTLEDIRLRADAQWSYESNANAHGIELELHVGPSVTNMDLVARHERSDLGTDGLTGSETLSGSLIQSTAFSVDNFTPTNGELTTGVVAELRLYIIRNGESVAKATQSESFEVTVSEEALQITAGVSGDGVVEFETGTPTES